MGRISSAFADLSTSPLHPRYRRQRWIFLSSTTPPATTIVSLLHRCYSSCRTNQPPLALRFHRVLFHRSVSLFRPNGAVGRFAVSVLSFLLSLPPLSPCNLLSLSRPCSDGGCGGSATAASPPPLPLFLARSISVRVTSNRSVTARHSFSRFSHTPQARRCRLARLVHNILPRWALSRAEQTIPGPAETPTWTSVLLVAAVVVVRVVVARGEVVVAVVARLYSRPP